MTDRWVITTAHPKLCQGELKIYETSAAVAINAVKANILTLYYLYKTFTKYSYNISRTSNLRRIPSNYEQNTVWSIGTFTRKQFLTEK